MAAWQRLSANGGPVPVNNRREPAASAGRAGANVR